jgi:hypothetical protein
MSVTRPIGMRPCRDSIARLGRVIASDPVGEMAQRSSRGAGFTVGAIGRGSLFREQDGPEQVGGGDGVSEVATRTPPRGN